MNNLQCEIRNHFYWPILFLLLDIVCIYRRILNFHKMHTNILINSNYETFRHTSTVHMNAQANEFFVFVFIVSILAKTWWRYILSALLYAFIHSCKSPNTYTHKPWLWMWKVSIAAECKHARASLGPPENCNFIEWNEYERMHELITRFLWLTLWDRLYALFHSHLSLNDVRSKFSLAALYAACVFICVIRTKWIVSNFTSVHSGNAQKQCNAFASK